MNTIPNRSSLIQRRGDVELPANGRWTLHRASFIGVSKDHDRRQLSVADGTLTVVDPPHESTLVIIAALREHWMRLTASTVAVDADTFGFSRWQFTGAVDDGTTRHAIELAMTYHGVYGRADQIRAWFTGHVTTPTVRQRFRPRRPQLDIVLDLLFDPPTTAASTTPNRHHEQPSDTVPSDRTHPALPVYQPRRLHERLPITSARQ